MKTGAWVTDDGLVRFVVWAPRRTSVELRINAPDVRSVEMHKDYQGYWHADVPGIGSHIRYLYRLDNDVERPDPASCFQPDGVHQASQVVDHHAYTWQDSAWEGRPLTQMVQYEMHVGTFTPEGTFDAAIPRLPDLADIGVNAIELMPVAQFPGGRNWGYDGVYPYAVQNSYGGPEGLKRLVDAAHRNGIAVILDVVYNHLGPEGNYLHDFAPYFTDTYKTPWGWAINFDGAHSDRVRDYFVENALMWFRDYHIDALRLDAIHGIFDMSARPFLQELAERVDSYTDESGKTCLLIAESDLNDSRVIKPREQGGYGIPAQWSDDFHHALHTLLTGEQSGYYADFGAIGHLVKAIRNGYVYDGRYSRYRRRSHGNSPAGCPAEQFIVFSQNHDQVGNRMKGDRLSASLPIEALKLAAGAVILGPNIPMLFMGEEYGEKAPFPYFVSHGDENLIEAVRNGRKEEFAAFGWKEAPPDPQSADTFRSAVLNWDHRNRGEHAAIQAFYRRLIQLRQSVPALSIPSKEHLEVIGPDEEKVIVVRRFDNDSDIVYVMNFNASKAAVPTALFKGSYSRVLDSADREYHGPGAVLPDSVTPDRSITAAPWNFAVYSKEIDS